MEQPILHGAAIDLHGEQPEVHGAGQFPRSSDRFARRKHVPCGPPYETYNIIWFGFCVRCKLPLDTFCAQC